MLGDEEGKPRIKRRKKDPNLKSQSVIENGAVVDLGNWTKKYDCPAQVIFQEILRFPEYKLTKNTKWTEIKTVRILRKDLKAMNDITCIRGFIVTVPEDSHHQNHVIGLGVGVWRELNPQLLNWIQSMVGQGLTSVAKMRKSLRHLVKENFPNVDTNNTHFYPPAKTIAYYMHLVRMRLLGTKDDPKDLEPQKGRFRKEKDEELCDYFLLPTRKSLTPFDEKEVISEVTEVIQEFEDMQDQHDTDDSSLPIAQPVVLASTPAKSLQTVAEEFRNLLLQMQSYSFSVRNISALQKAHNEVEQAFTNLKKTCKMDQKIMANVGKNPNYQKRRVERIEVKCEKVVDLKPPTIRQVTYPSKRRKRDIELQSYPNMDFRSDENTVQREVAAVKLELTDDGSVLNITEYL
ncbi:uncharacterized protein LOC135219226 [Macrobrachium nipponense]|uniref:uncharacterized protein LOC135219226 n=1 Tax=Macrobrachium nipponense TaxID=159736 RepID=UPI0030C8D169